MPQVSACPTCPAPHHPELAKVIMWLLRRK